MTKGETSGDGSGTVTGDLEVRLAATPDELRQALAIRHAVFVEEQQIPEELDDDGHDSEAIHVLVLDTGRPVGTGRLVVEPDRRGILARIAVVPRSRGRGIGGRVVRALEREARNHGVEELRLYPHVYLERFYRELGYSATGETSVVVEHRLIEMTRRIEPARDRE